MYAMMTDLLCDIIINKTVIRADVIESINSSCTVQSFLIYCSENEITAPEIISLPIH